MIIITASINDYAVDRSHSKCTGVVLPLSLLAFSATAAALSYPYTPVDDKDTIEPLGGGGGGGACEYYGPQVSGLSHLFRRHVKPKKQHEIKELAKVCGRIFLK